MIHRCKPLSEYVMGIAIMGIAISQDILFRMESNGYRKEDVNWYGMGGWTVMFTAIFRGTPTLLWK
jgi:hypothetical protein